jgi:hypothetical protein
MSACLLGQGSCMMKKRRQKPLNTVPLSDSHTLVWTQTVFTDPTYLQVRKEPVLPVCYSNAYQRGYTV